MDVPTNTCMFCPPGIFCTVMCVEREMNGCKRDTSNNQWWMEITRRHQQNDAAITSATAAATNELTQLLDHNNT